MNTMIQACCERTTPEAGGVKVFTLRAQGGTAEFLHTIQPGRHVAIYYPDSAGATQQRFYSITRKQNDLFEIAVKRSGRSGVSDHLHSTLHEGSVVPLQYVAGDISVDAIIDRERIGMIAGGIGITLPIALLRELAARSRNGQHVPAVALILCIQKISDIPFLHKLLELALTTRWFNFRVFITRESVQTSGYFASGRPSAESLEILGQPQTVVICGSHAFAQDFREHVTTRFPAARLLIESFTSPVVPVFSGVLKEEIFSPLQLCVVGSEKVIDAFPGKSLLEMLESNGVPIRSQCRSGICGTCRVKISGGECQFEPDFCLSDHDKHNGHALACCTSPLAGSITVDLKPNA